MCADSCPLFFFFNDTATTEIYTLSLHDALPICIVGLSCLRKQDSAFHAENPRTSQAGAQQRGCQRRALRRAPRQCRSEEHTSELQSLAYLVCRLLLEKKKNKIDRVHNNMSVQP